MTPERLSAVQAEGFSLARLADHWYAACLSSELGTGPKSTTVLGTPLALFRGKDGVPAALLDRCPHRNTPLSYGRVQGANLQCRYHGWEFDAKGECRAVPGLCDPPGAKARRAEAYPVREASGIVWVYMTPGEAPQRAPYLPPLSETPGYTTVRRALASDSTLFLTLENVLDVPHTAFLHGGLFRRAGGAQDIETVVRLYADRVEAQFIGEARPTGLVGRLFSPGGGVVEHFDRFLLPSIAQVEYRLGADSHLLITSFMTPETEFRTRQYAVISFRTPLPGPLLRLLIEPVGRRIFEQDVQLLKRQTANLRRFGGEDFASTEADVLGLSIWKLLKDAEAGRTSREPGVLSERRTRLRL